MSKEVNFLVLESKKGNKKAQIKLYDLYCDAMFSISCRYIKNNEEAKDVMQDGFLKAFLNIDFYIENTSFGSWLKKIVINTCIDFLKKKVLDTISIENYSLEIIDDDDSWTFDIKITKKEIIEAIEKLKTKHQIVVKLYLIEGYDHSEISEILKIPVTTSKTHLRRGKMELRNFLKAKNYGT